MLRALAVGIMKSGELAEESAVVGTAKLNLGTKVEKMLY
jgi:hypothetical protein